MDGGKSSSKGESHRIFWQQWPSVAASKSKPTVSSRRDLITSSAAVRISPVSARAQDVTELLCEILNLKDPKNSNSPASSPRQESWDIVQDAWEQDALVLVGTLYSLPLQHVRFEHERLEQMSSQALDAPAANIPTRSRNDPPFHVIQTLKGTDNPVQVRNEMKKYLESILQESAAATPLSNSKRPTSIAPKLQWYFVPGANHPSSPIPSYIDLEGYSTSMEEEDTDEEEDLSRSGKNHDGETQDTELDFDPLEQQSNVSLSLQDQDSLNDAVAKESSPTTSTISEKERIFKKERQLYFELSLSQSSHQQDNLSGYLLKQSMTDPHVWKRMHCVLTDEYLWFISRIYTRFDDDPGKGDPKARQPEFYSFAKHRRMGLTRALLVQPSADKPTMPLLRTPFAFEIIDANGSAHRFRASTPKDYKRWVTALQSRIVQAYENSLLEHAELIVRDETEARNKRFKTVAVEPLWENQMQHCGGNISNIRHTPMHAPTLQILRFGMEVTRYREHCRHIEAILPAKSPVLAMTDSTLELALNGSQNQQSDSPSVKGSTSSAAFRWDTKTQALIKSAWDEAVRLGSRATKLAVALQSKRENDSAKMPRSLETICQHLEYVISGTFRGSNGKHGSRKPSNQRPDNTLQYPPPIDLFDQLLIELQFIASATALREDTKEKGTKHTPLAIP